MWVALGVALVAVLADEKGVVNVAELPPLLVIWVLGAVVVSAMSALFASQVASVVPLISLESESSLRVCLSSDVRALELAVDVDADVCARINTRFIDVDLCEGSPVERVKVVSGSSLPA